ncbi:PKD domain-containing protein [Methanosarcina sp. DH2]|uniref:PKD domain-containing protein n=1 Tax=Methanosarcina sp. DH2 TaxID=2605639 RepID=UPI0023DEC88E|nr:PKD domain-containing protein [Methanosarcina sp. DH2]MCC4771150.1 PKD domain-containing protein [Methanosarcina sp. DH2]
MSAEKRKVDRVCELKQITVLILLFLVSSALAVVVGSDVSSAADGGNESISADFLASQVSGEAPLTIQFTDASTGPVTSWLWEFGDGSTSSDKDPSHTYSGAGIYDVALTVDNGTVPVSVVKDDYITVTEKHVVPVVEASFNSNVTSGKAPLTVRFEDRSSGGPTSWKWDFGDGTSSTAQNPVHTYTVAETYSVTLIATNGTVSDDITESNYITVGSGPTASFSASPLEGEAPLTVQFTDTSTGSVTYRLWEFGDGSTSNAKNPLHIYSRAGTYTVKLTVTNSFDSDTFEAPSFIRTYSIAAPVANFTSDTTSGAVPLTVRFTDLSLNGPTSWEWDFNSDGKIDSREQNPVYVYTSSGTYSVTLNAVNGTARGNTKKSNYINAGGAPVASFSASPQEGNAPLTVQFTDTSTGNVTSWLWDFGDGNNSTSQSPSHIYSSSGKYTVGLTVTNAFGSNTFKAPSFVNVLSIAAPAPDFTSNVISGKAPLIVRFEDRSSGGPTAWEWDFNSDGTIDSIEQNPVYEFTDNGSYTVTLRVGNGTAWNNLTKSNYIMVGDGLHASFTVSARKGGAPLTVQFNDTSTGNITTWFWDFGDGNTSASQSPSHEYSEPGSYSVTLNISSAYGYSAVTWADYIQVGEEEDSSGSGSSGGTSSGGGGGSPEPASNIEVKELSQEFITNGDSIRFEFAKNATSITYVKFDAKKNFGKTTTIVEQLKNRSVLTPKEPSGKVYRYMNIWVGNEGFATPENIANAIIGFRVNRAEITENKTGGPTIFMYRYSDGKWNALPTRKTGEDSQYMYFEARTPGFSPFAIITGKKAVEYKEGESEETAEPLELSIATRQSEMPEKTSWSVPAADDKDWTGTSMAIKVIVGVMVILLIGLAVREKKKR